MKKKTKKPSLSKLKKKLDQVFSHWVRERDHHVCFTCQNHLDPKSSQCGHYIPRLNMNTRWDERNCHAQCKQCNIFKKGAMDVYAVKLIEKYGDNILIDLQGAKHQIKKWTIKELEEMIFRYSPSLSPEALEKAEKLLKKYASH